MPFGNMGGWTFVLILVIVLLLFGAPKLPKLAKSIGESMRIFKGEMKTMKNDPNSSAGTQQNDAASSEASSGQSISGETPRTQTPPPPTSSDGNDSPTR